MNQIQASHAKLCIRNLTHYRTDDLKRFVLAALKGYGLGERRTVQFEYTRQRYSSSGCAFVHSTWANVRLVKGPSGKPKEKFVELPEWAVKSAAHVLVHELQHNEGLQHEGGSNSGGCNTWKRDADNIGSWWVGLKVRARGSAVKAPAPRHERLNQLVSSRAERARTRLTEIESTLRRYTKLRTKWRRKTAYYAKVEEKRAATTPAPS